MGVGTVVVVQGYAFNKHLPGHVANNQPPTLGHQTKSLPVNFLE